MALSILRTARLGACFYKGMSSKLLTKQQPVLAAVQSKNLMLTPIKKGRIYGPEEEHEKVDDVHHWMNERYIAVALLPIIPACMAYPHPIFDTILCSAMVLHTHWRLSGVCEDYIHGELLPKIHQPLVLLLSIITFGSLCVFNYTDVGFANAVRMIYTQL